MHRAFSERLCKARAEAKLAWTMPSRRQTSVENELVRAMPSAAENIELVKIRATYKVAII